MRGGTRVAAERIRDACWEWACPPQTDEGWERFTARVAESPEEFWESVRQFISEAPDVPNARLFGGALAALIELGGKWPERVAEAARHDARLASTLEDALMDDGRTYRLLGRRALVDAWVRYQSGESPWDSWASEMLACLKERILSSTAPSKRARSGVDPARRD